MRELDAVLQGFLEREFDALSEQQKSLFADVLNLPDPEVYAYLAQRSVPEDPDIAGIFESIRRSIRPAK
jgi:succinate dehydrogenase flavin-adding protein (antitoxin of CptAB toxin-antitoxin module)